MTMKEVKDKMKLTMGGAFMVGALALFFVEGSLRWKIGFGFIGFGLVLAFILQFILGEDIIRFRKPKKMEVK